MKTKDEILENLHIHEVVIDIAGYVTKCTEGLNDNVLNGYKSYTLIIDDGSYARDMETAKKVASELNQMGFYAKSGWMETTLPGNERPIVEISLDKPNRYKQYWRKHDINIIVMLTSLLFAATITLISIVL